MKYTVEQIGENFKIVEAEYEQRMIDDAEFAKSAAIIGEWLAKNSMKCGYKRLARLLVSEYKGQHKK
jgi:hypothetical protein